MEVVGKLFQESRFCSWCHCPIPDDSETDLCKNCQASMEFREVREYVREHDVNEFQLAEVFGIPLRQVKQWIREGRLEYKEDVNLMTTLYCQRCGKKIRFGNFCPECNKAQYGVKGGFETFRESDADEQIRFYNKNRR